jgi:hypothetical protein
MILADRAEVLWLDRLRVEFHFLKQFVGPAQVSRIPEKLIERKARGADGVTNLYALTVAGKTAKFAKEIAHGLARLALVLGPRDVGAASGKFTRPI